MDGIAGNQESSSPRRDAPKKRVKGKKEKLAMSMSGNVGKLAEEEAKSKSKEAEAKVVERLCVHYHVDDPKGSSLASISKNDIKILVRELISSARDVTMPETRRLEKAEALQRMIVGDGEGEPSL